MNWDPVPQIDQNGIILYEVRYDPLETFGGQIATGYENTTSGSELMITLEDLQEYVEYNISVRAQDRSLMALCGELKKTVSRIYNVFCRDHIFKALLKFCPFPPRSHCGPYGSAGGGSWSQ